MRQKVGVFDCFQETMDKIGSGGALLVAGEKGNPMTIGWGTAGIIWGKPIFIVLVRPSRYTFGLMEQLDEFTVNVPTGDLKKQVAYCGSKSGRDVDKVAECGFTMEKSTDIAVPYIEQCPIHYECRTVHKSNVINATLDPDIVSSSYPAGDFHSVYYGEILGVYREQD